MGLLDDAIREHLELKRRRGADPGEVAREEREVLSEEPRDGDDAAHGASWASPATAADTADEHAAEVAEHAPAEHDHADPDHDGAGHEHAEPDHGSAAHEHDVREQASVGLQETAEIDMSRVLEGDDHTGASRAPARAQREEHFSAESTGAGPGVFEDPDGGRHGHVPGQESFPFE